MLTTTPRARLEDALVATIDQVAAGLTELIKHGVLADALGERDKAREALRVARDYAWYWPAGPTRDTVIATIDAALGAPADPPPTCSLCGGPKRPETGGRWLCADPDCPRAWAAEP